MSTPSEINIRLATEDDFEAIQAGFRNYYWPHEALSSGFKITKPSEVEEAFFFSVLEKGHTLVAADQDDKVIGFLTNDIYTPNSVEEFEDKIQGYMDERLAALKAIFGKLDSQANFFTKYGVDKVFLMFNLAVNPAMRGKSIGVKLFERAFELAKSEGLKVIGVDCTGCFSIRIAERLGMQSIGEICYKDFKDENGEVIFKPSPIHTHMRRFVKIL